MLENKNYTIWITGASSGIGKAMAFEWAKLGYDVALSARRTELLEEVATDLRKLGVQVLAVPVDVMEESSVKNAVETIISSFGRLDIAIANAGFGVFGLIEELSQEEWQRQLQGNVVGLAMTAKYALPHLKKTKGRLALVGSVGAF
jgi:NADP-dependent 3-hydroxy acid dehydrogenase YdfG